MRSGLSRGERKQNGEDAALHILSEEREKCFKDSNPLRDPREEGVGIHPHPRELDLLTWRR